MSKKQLAAAFLALALGLNLAACGGGKTATQDKTAEKTQESQSPQTSDGQAAKLPQYTPARVRVAYMPTIGSAGTLLAGIEQGYFKQVNLEVELFQFQGGPAEIAAMGSGDIDIAEIGHGAHALCIEGKAVIFQNDHTNSLADEVVANKAKGISKPEDLKGKTVAVAAGTSSEVILDEVLAKAGLKKSDIKTVEMTNDAMTTAMVSGQVDACAAWSPNTITLRQNLGENYLRLGGNADFSDRATFPASFICLESYAKEQREVLLRFAAAVDRANAYHEAHREEVARLVSQKLDLPLDTLLAAKDEGDWKTITEISGDREKLDQLYKVQQQVFLNSGRIKQERPVEDYVLLDLMVEAHDLAQKLN